jgi:polysaccharide deacetylase 2 family uncharacterized protein YibQ
LENGVKSGGKQRRKTHGGVRALGVVGGVVLVFALGAGVGLWLGDLLPSEAPVVVKAKAVPAAKVAQDTASESPKTPKKVAAAPVIEPAAPASTESLAKASPETKVAKAPVSAASKDSDYRAVWMRHAVAAPVSGDRPMTMAYLAYAKDLPAQTARARAAGHELMLHMPMEPSIDADPGPNVLRVNAKAEQIRAHMDDALGRFTGFIGVNNHMGSRFTANETAMRVMLGTLKSRGLLFLDSLTTARSVARRVGRKLGLPVVARDVFLDDDNSPDEVLIRLAETERVARKHGSAIAIGHPRDHTIEVLQIWLQTVREKGFDLVPLSAVAKHRLPKKFQQAMLAPATDP